MSHTACHRVFSCPPTHVIAVLGCLVPGICQSEPALKPRVGASVIYSDNIELAETNEKSDVVTELTAGINYQREGGRIKANVDYELQGLSRDSGNDVYHKLDAGTTVEVVEDLFYLDADADIFQTVTNPEDTIAVDNISTTSNRTDVVTAGISPYLSRAFDNGVELLARARYSVVDYADSGEDSLTSNNADADIFEGNFSLGNIRDDSRRWTWQTGYDYLRTEDDADQRDVLKSAYATGGFRPGARIQILLTAGDDDNSFTDESQADTSGFYWNSTAVWDPSSRNHVELGVGDRYGGTVYNFLWQNEGRRTKFDISYDHSLDVDANVTAVEHAEDGIIDVVRLNADSTVFQRKNFSVQSVITLSKSVFTLRFGNERREGANGDNEKLVTLSGDWVWEFSGRTSLDLSVLAVRQELAGADQNDDIGQVGVGLAREFGRQVQGRIEYSRTEQDSDDNTNDYKENRIWLSLSKTF